MARTEALSELDKTLRLLALVALEGKKQREQIALLDRAGFGQANIAEVLGTTAKAVSVRLAEIRRAARQGKR